jgi:uncharacterized cupin superfamily protein
VRGLLAAVTGEWPDATIKPSNKLTLITDTGEETLRAGDCAAFRSSDPDGHHLVNKSGRPARVLEIGTSDRQDRCTYPDIDMIADHRGYTHRDGTRYP